MISFLPMCSMIYMLITPKLLSLARNFPLNFGIIHLIIKFVQMEHLISTSSVCPPSPNLGDNLKVILNLILSMLSANKTSQVHFQKNHPFFFLPLYFPTLVQAATSSHLNIYSLIHSLHNREIFVKCKSNHVTVVLKLAQGFLLL